MEGHKINDNESNHKLLDSALCQSRYCSAQYGSHEKGEDAEGVFFHVWVFSMRLIKTSLRMNL